MYVEDTQGKILSSPQSLIGVCERAVHECAWKWLSVACSVKHHVVRKTEEALCKWCPFTISLSGLFVISELLMLLTMMRPI